MHNNQNLGNPPTPATPATPPRGGKGLWKKLLTDNSYWLSFFLLLVLAAVISQYKNVNFFRWQNIMSIFKQSATTDGIIALGMTMIICAGMIDISVGAQVAFISGMGIMLLNTLYAATGNPAISILLMLVACLGMGLCIGSINGVLVAKGRMPAMIATLAMQSICRSVINHLGQKGPFTIPAQEKELYSAFNGIANGSLKIADGIAIPYPILIFILLALLFGVIMQRTKLGKHIYAVGSNEKAAKLAGVNVNRTKILAFAITGMLCGFVGWQLASQYMSLSPTNTGNLFEMNAIAAVAIGGTSMSGGRGKIIGAFLGALMFKIINNLLSMADVPTFLNGAISGGIILIAVLMQNLQNKDK